MIDKKFVRRKLDLIQMEIEKLESLKGKSFEEVAENQIEWDALEWWLAKLIGRAIDINNHILGEYGERLKRAPVDYTETFLFLKDLGILPEEFARRISKSAGFRNRVIHEYNDIDKVLVFETIDDAIRDYAKYCEYVLEWLEKV